MNKAAQKLFLTQPALNAAMNVLEKDLGFSILSRSSKGIYLTAAGTQVVQDAEIILNILKSWRALASINEPVCCNVSIVSFAPVCSHILPQLMIKLQEDYPFLNISIGYQSELEECLNIIFSEQYCMGIVGITLQANEKKIFKTIDKNNYQAQHLMTDFYHVIFRKEHPLAAFSEIPLDKLKPFPIALYSSNRFFDGNYQKLLLDHFRNDQHVFLGNNESIFTYLKQSDAISFFPEMFIHFTDAFSSGELLHAKLSDYVMPLKHYLVYPTDQYLTAMDRIIIDAVKEAYCSYQKTPKK